MTHKIEIKNEIWRIKFLLSFFALLLLTPALILIILIHICPPPSTFSTPQPQTLQIAPCTSLLTSTHPVYQRVLPFEETCRINEIDFERVYTLSDYERWYIECIVAGEANGESLLGKMAVAQCIRNAMIRDELTPMEVRDVYKYSGWNENLETVDEDLFNEVELAVWCVFDNGESVTEEEILWFYAPKRVKGVPFHESQKFVCEIGGHKFFAPND